MLHSKHEIQEKKWRQWRKESRKAWDEQRRMPYVPVDEPYQNGWKVSIHLRDDIARRQDVDDILKALSMCSYRAITRYEHNVRVVRQHRSYTTCLRLFKGDFYNRYSVYGGPRLGPITKEQYKNLTATVARFFSIASSWEARKHPSKYKDGYELNIPYYWLIVKTTPNIVREVKALNVEAKKKEKYLDDKLNQEYSWRCEGSGRYRRYDTRSDSKRHRAVLKVAKNKYMRGEIEEIPLLKRDLTNAVRNTTRDYMSGMAEPFE